ncbi:MAG: amidohydrolase, partial [Lachnospiraceae bacterium]|nr:amidohydrolase [Lachnospiraceae bacterium]
MLYEEYLSEIDRFRDGIFGVSDAIYDFAETAYHEKASAETLAKALEDHGFTVERGAAGIPTCFIATYG